MKTQQQLRQEAYAESQARILDARITHKFQLYYFLMNNFGLGATTGNRILEMLQGIGKIDVSEDGEINVRNGQA